MNPNDDNPTGSNPPSIPNKSSMVLQAEERRKQLQNQQLQQNAIPQASPQQNAPSYLIPQQTAPSQGLRMDLIQKAVQFLTNPSVRDTPATRKMAFLKEKKGLTQEEVEEAFRQSGTDLTDATSAPQQKITANNQPNVPYQLGMMPQQMQMQQMQPVVPSRENRDAWGWKNTLLAVSAVGGLLGFGAMVAKNYSPWIISKITGKEYVSEEEELRRAKQDKKKKKKKNAKKMEKLMEEKKKTQELNSQIELSRTLDSERTNTTINNTKSIVSFVDNKNDNESEDNDKDLIEMKEMIVKSLSQQAEETERIFQTVKELLGEIREGKSSQVLSQKQQAMQLTENKESLSRIENIVQNVKSLLSNRNYGSSSNIMKPPTGPNSNINNPPSLNNNSNINPNVGGTNISGGNSTTEGGRGSLTTSQSYLPSWQLRRDEDKSQVGNNPNTNNSNNTPPQQNNNNNNPPPQQEQTNDNQQNKENEPIVETQNS